MKICPSCHLRYSDESFEFCLSNGTRLIEEENLAEEPGTRFASPSLETQKIPTILPDWRLNQETVVSEQEIQKQNSPLPAIETKESKLSFVSQMQKAIVKFGSSKSAAIVAIALALAHNYWQWLYMARPTAFEFPEFLWSVNFLVWFFLLVSGAVACLLTLRFGKNGKGYAVVGLVILAVNLLLCIVPRRF